MQAFVLVKSEASDGATLISGARYALRETDGLLRPAELTDAAKKPHLPSDALAPNSLGRVWGESSLAYAVGGLLSKLEKQSHKFHSLRHYFVTSLFNAGAGAPTVRDLAGHRHMQVTARYAHSDEGARRRAIEALGRLAS